MKLQVESAAIAALGKRYYSMPLSTIIVREALQNALDAGASKIDVAVEKQDDTIILTISDNGDGIQSFSEHFATVGGSKKTRAKSIGGYGIGIKLSLMSCDDWFVQSKQGLLTKAMLDNDLDADASQPCEGTKIVGKIVSPYAAPVKSIEKILKLSYFYDVLVTYNGEPVSPYMGIETTIDGKTCWQVVGLDTNDIFVRLNGLFMFGMSYYASGQASPSYLYDVKTTLTPYDDNYPLIANREGFVEGGEASRSFQSFCRAVQKIASDKAEAEKVNREGMTLINGLLASMGATRQTVQRLRKTKTQFERIVAKIQQAMDTSYLIQYGVAGAEAEYNACIKPRDDGSYVIMLSENVEDMTKGELWSIALHEYAHILHEDHYESYAQWLTEVTGVVMNAIATHLISW